MLATELVRRGLVFRIKAKPDGNYSLLVAPRNKIASNLRAFVKNHKPEILDELFDIGTTAMQRQLVTCPSCGSPTRWWQDKDTESGALVAWWICEECGRMHRERPA